MFEFDSERKFPDKCKQNGKRISLMLIRDSPRERVNTEEGEGGISLYHSMGTGMGLFRDLPAG